MEEKTLGYLLLKNISVILVLISFFTGLIVIATSLAAYLHNPFIPFVVEHLDVSNEFDGLRSAVIAGMAIGILTVIACILGCFAVCRQSHWPILVFLIILSILVMVEYLTAGCMIELSKSSAREVAERLSDAESIAMRNGTNSKECQFFRTLSNHHVCCGHEGNGVPNCLTSDECLVFEGCMAKLMVGIHNQLFNGAIVLFAATVPQIVAVVLTAFQLKSLLAKKNIKIKDIVISRNTAFDHETNGNETSTIANAVITAVI